MKLVLDASVAVAAARPNEIAHHAARGRIARIFRGHEDIIVPAIFAIEVGASLARVGEDAEAIGAYVDALMSTTTDVVTIGPINAKRIREVAITLRLRAADAVYVWLATRERIPLCTLDKEIAQRCKTHCQIVEP